MSELGCHIHRPALLLQCIEIAFPTPLHALVQGGTGDILDAFHQLDEPMLPARSYRGEADSAIAHYDTGHAVPARWSKLLVPGRLSIVMGMNIDEAGRDQKPVGIDDGFIPLRCQFIGYLGDQPAVEAHVGTAGNSTVAVGQGSPADQSRCHDDRLLKPGYPVYSASALAEACDSITCFASTAL